MEIYYAYGSSEFKSTCEMGMNTDDSGNSAT
jgi:hypothetical protein